MPYDPFSAFSQSGLELAFIIVYDSRLLAALRRAPWVKAKTQGRQSRVRTATVPFHALPRRPSAWFLMPARV